MGTRLQRGWSRLLRPRMLVALALCLAAGLSALHVVALRLVSAAIIQSPCAGKPAPAMPPPKEVSRRIAVDVGPPAARIVAWVMDPTPSAGQANPPPRGTIVVVHGIHSEKQDMLGVGRFLAAAGYRVVLVDLRGHGESTGPQLSFGVNESCDLSQLLDRLQAEDLLAGSVGAYGASFGGATVLMLAGRDSRVKSAVAICPFSSMREIVPQYVRGYLPAGRLVPDWWISRAIDRSGRLAGFDPGEADAARAVRESAAHVLLMHGKADVNIPFIHSQAIAGAAPDRARLILLDGEDHTSIMQDRSGTIGRETLAWFAAHLGPVVASSPGQ